MKLKTQLLIGTMTAAERQMGRYMRAPDEHSGGGGGADGEGAGSGSGQQSEKLSTEQQLEKDFGYDETLEGGEGEEEGEDLGSSAQDDSSDNSGEDGDADEGDDADGGDEPEGGKPNRTQERIDELTNAARESDRKAAEATREATKWRRIAEGAPAAEPVAEGEKDPNAAPNPADYPFGVADPEYISDNAVHKVRSEMRTEGEQARIRADLNDLEASYQSRVPAALEKYPDYDLKVIQGADGDTPTWACPPIVAIGIRASEVGTDIAYHLATNPDEAARIATLTNVEQAREFGRLEGRFEYEASLKTKEAGEEDNQSNAPKKKSAAPTPPRKQLRGGGGQFKVPADTDDFAAFDKTYGN